jgi:hypothetical protein
MQARPGGAWQRWLLLIAAGCALQCQAITARARAALPAADSQRATLTATNLCARARCGDALARPEIVCSNATQVPADRVELTVVALGNEAPLIGAEAVWRHRYPGGTRLC